MQIFKAVLLVAAISFVGKSLAADCSCFSTAMKSKSDYSLFNPTPDSLLRDLDTDRPNKTNSPKTLDAGHFQIETGLLGYSHDSHSLDGTHTKGWTVTDTDLRIGLTNWAEIQFEIPFYQSVRTTDTLTGKTQHASGIGDLSIFFLANFWGNDKGDTAGGIEFFVKTPTASHGLGNGKVEGGALILLATKLPGDFDLGINTGVGISANDDGGYHADIINSVSVSHAIVGPISAYAEFFSSVPTQHSSGWEGTIDVGFTFQIGKNFQFDAGMNIGVTRAADDLETFFGVSYRF
ncbi:MAG: transporter [Verrucomicrobiaceae bacterium]